MNCKMWIEEKYGLEENIAFTDLLLWTLEQMQLQVSKRENSTNNCAHEAYLHIVQRLVHK